MLPPGGKKPDGFALLIGKRLAGKGKSPPEEEGDGGDPYDEDGDEPEDAKKEEMENSAISDFMSAKDPQTAKAALKDFLELCYPELGGGEEEPPEEPAAEGA